MEKEKKKKKKGKDQTLLAPSGGVEWNGME